MKKKYAEDLPYWKSGTQFRRAIDEALNAISKNGGEITAEGTATIDGVTAFFVQFKMDGDEFRFVEKIAETRSRHESAKKSAKIQAAASLKHSIKARVNEAVRSGARKAFMSSLILPNGRVAHEESNISLQKLFAPSDQILLGSGDEIQGEWE